MTCQTLAPSEARTYFNADMLEPEVFELAGGSVAVLSARRPEKTTANEDADSVDISCTGTSTDGEDLALEGQTDEIPGASVTELEGSFTGTADGEEVFSVDTLGG